MQIKAKITGFKITHIVYDAFGEHVKSVSNSEVKNFGLNEIKTLEGTWRVYDSKATDMLTYVTFIIKVRYKDGAHWAYNESALIQELANLNLEEIADIENED